MKVVQNITGFIDDLNLSKKDILIIIAFLALAGTAWSASQYKKEANRLQTALNVSQDELRIERNKEKLEDNLEWIDKLKDANKKNVKELEVLWEKFGKLDTSAPVKSSYKEKLENVKTASEACEKLKALLGYDCVVINMDMNDND